MQLIPAYILQMYYLEWHQNFYSQKGNIISYNALFHSIFVLFSGMRLIIALFQDTINVKDSRVTPIRHSNERLLSNSDFLQADIPDASIIVL